MLPDCVSYFNKSCSQWLDILIKHCLLCLIYYVKMFTPQAKGQFPSVSFHEPLLLREFFFTMACANPGLHKMDNNPMSVQYPWEENAEGLQRWKNVSATCGKSALLSL